MKHYLVSWRACRFHIIIRVDDADSRLLTFGARRNYRRVYQIKTLVDADMKVAEENGIKETPTLVIDGKIYAGMQSEDALAKLVYVAR